MPQRKDFLTLAPGFVIAAVLARWLFDRPSISLHRILKDNYSVLDKEEIAMAHRLLLAGHGATLSAWPRAGVHDAHKKRLVRAAAAQLADVSSSSKVIKERLATLQAPVAIQRPKTLSMHGDEREDPFYWIRDDDRKDPAVLAHIDAENKYTAAALAPTEAVQGRLFKEMRGRIQETDQSVATRRDGFWYYTRTLEGEQYGIHCRRPAGDASATEDETSAMDESKPEEVLLDENKEAAKHSFYNTGAVSVSPDNSLLCFAEDTVGGEKYNVRVIDLKTRKSVLAQPIGDCSGNVVWAADSKTVFFAKQDDKMRPYQIYRQTIDGKPALVYEDLDEAYYVQVFKTHDKQLIIINSGATLQNEMHYIRADQPQDGFQALFKRTPDIDIDVDHWHGALFMTRRTKDTPNSEVLVAPLSDPASPRMLLEHREHVKIEDSCVTDGYFAIVERSAEKGLQECHVYTLPSSHKYEEVQLRGSDKLSFEEAAYTLDLAGHGDFGSPVLLLAYSSLTTPTTWMAHNMATGKRETRKVMPVQGGFSADNYRTERLWAESHDGVKVPVTVVYNHNAVDRSKPAPLHLDAYGAYELCNDPAFSRNRVSLLDRGIVYAIAHVRGGGDLGRMWYETGKFVKKRNTFLDVIAAGEHLVQQGWTQPECMTLEGRSAGGMTVGAVANMRPDLFTGIVAGVPFVDCLTTMLDDSIPLTVGEYDEWGNPNEKEFYDYMKTYSPVDNVEAKEYPNILVTAGLHDPRVAYWEPAKWTAKLRLMKTDSNMLFFKCDMGAGHFSQSGRFDALKELAIDYAFILLCLDKLQTDPIEGSASS